MVFPSWILYLLGIAMFAGLGYVAKSLLVPSKEEVGGKKKKKK